MTIHTYGPTVLPVNPESASDVRVTCKDGSSPTFTTPVTVDPTTHAVSFAVDDHGAPPVELVLRVQSGPGGSSTTFRVVLPEPAPPAPPAGGGGITVETDPVASAAVVTERDRAEAAEASASSAEASEVTARTAETTRAEGAESGEVTRAEGAEAAETTRAEAAETSESSARGAHASNPTNAHAASAVSVNASGLIVVTHTNVQAALADLDAQAHANANAIAANTAAVRFTNDLLGNRPTPAAYGVGWYFASDDNGGRLYHSDGTNWTQVTAGLNWASGTQLAYVTDPALNFDAKAVGATFTDLTNFHITIPASAVPVKVHGKMWGQSATATAAAAVVNALQLQLTDSNNVQYDIDNLTVAQVTAGTSYSSQKSFYVCTTLPAPFAGGTFKLRARTNPTPVAAWGTVQFMGNAAGGTFPVAFLEAVAE